MKATNIVWDMDDGIDNEIIENLPTEMEFPDELFDGGYDDVADYLLDQTGWCVESFEIEDNNTYPEYVMKNVRQNLGLEPNDTSMDSEINNMSKREVFARCLEWEGIIGYEYKILSLISEIFGVDLIDQEDKK